MKIRRLRIPPLAALVAALALLAPQPAFAVRRVAVWDVRTVITQSGSRGLIVAEELASDVKLPAEVRLPVPKGARVSWAGEILGGDPSQDPTAQYRTEPGGEYDTIVFTVMQARRGQVELDLPAPVADPDGTVLELRWQPSEAADRAQLAVEVPAGAQVSSATAGASASTAGNSTYYVKEFPTVAAGEVLELAVTYNGGTALPQRAPQQQQPSAKSPSASPLLVVGALGAILAGTFFLLEKVRPRDTAGHG